MGAAQDSRGRMGLIMISDGALAIIPENPRGPFSGSHPWLTSLLWEETHFWRKLWVPSPPPSLPTNKLFLFTTPISGKQ